MAQIASEFWVHPNQVRKWKDQLLSMYLKSKEFAMWADKIDKMDITPITLATIRSSNKTVSFRKSRLKKCLVRT
jgi:transposase-like protein